MFVGLRKNLVLGHCFKVLPSSSLNSHALHNQQLPNILNFVSGIRGLLVEPITTCVILTPSAIGTDLSNATKKIAGLIIRLTHDKYTNIIKIAMPKPLTLLSCS